MEKSMPDGLIQFDLEHPIWDRIYTVAPLVVVGTKGIASFDLAPKHLAMPMGWDNYFCFVCTPSHQTYKNIELHKKFTVSFVKPDNLVLASLAASPKCGPDSEVKKVVSAMPTFKSNNVDAPFLQNSYLYLDCRLNKIIDGFGRNSLIIGNITHAFAEPDALRKSDIDDAEVIQKNPMIVYLPPNRFAEIKDSQAFPFPKDFKK